MVSSEVILRNFLKEATRLFYLKRENKTTTTIINRNDKKSFKKNGNENLLIETTVIKIVNVSEGPLNVCSVLMFPFFWDKP